MPTRDRFIARMKAQLDDWSAELHSLEGKAGHLREDLRDSYRHAVQELHDRLTAVEARLGEIGHAGDDRWEHLRDEVERASKAFRAGLDAIREFSDHS